MSKFEFKKVGRKPVFPWHKLEKVGDGFLLSGDSKQAHSCRTAAVQQKIKVSVRAVKHGGYYVERVK